MHTHKFRGRDPILTFEFLTRYVKETYKLAMPERQAYILLSKFLSNFAEAQFGTVQASSRYRGATVCPEAVQHLLQFYLRQAL